MADALDIWERVKPTVLAIESGLLHYMVNRHFIASKKLQVTGIYVTVYCELAHPPTRLDKAGSLISNIR